MSLLVRKVNALRMRTTFVRVPRVNGRAMKHDARTRSGALERQPHVLSHHHHGRLPSTPTGRSDMVTPSASPMFPSASREGVHGKCSRTSTAR